MKIFFFLFYKILTKAVKHPMPEPIANEPINTTKKLPNDLSIRPRSKSTRIALATYFSIELNNKIQNLKSIINKFYFARTKQTASLSTLSPNIIA